MTSIEDMSEVRALSVRQPWAALIVNGYKPIENRSRTTSFRGLFYVHASKWPRTVRDRRLFASACARVECEFGIKVPVGECLEQRGRIIGCAKLIQVFESQSASKWHEPGSLGWVLSEAAPISSTLEHPGAQGFFRLPLRVAEVLARTPRLQPRAETD